MMNPAGNIVIEIYADIVRVALTGYKRSICIFVEKLNENLKKDAKNKLPYTCDTVGYYYHRIGQPVCKIQETLSNQYQTQISLMNDLESMHCYAFADIASEQNFFFIVLTLYKTQENKYILGLPSFDVMNGTMEIEKTIVSQLEKLTGLKLDSIDESVHPVGILGEQNEILLFSALVKDVPGESPKSEFNKNNKNNKNKNMKGGLIFITKQLYFYFYF